MKRFSLPLLIFTSCLVSTVSGFPVVDPPAWKHQDSTETKAVTYLLRIAKGKDLSASLRVFDVEVGRELQRLTERGWQVAQVTPTQFMQGEDLVISYLYTLKRYPIRR